MKKRVISLAFLFIVGFIMSVSTVWACSCGGPSCSSLDTVSSLKPETGVVFVGTVKKIEEVDDQITINNKVYETTSRKVSFEITEVLGGGFIGEKVVYTGSLRDSCAYRFKAQEKYLVRARYDAKENVYRTSKCMMTKKFEEATNEIKIIKEFAKGQVNENRLFGQVITTVFRGANGYLKLKDIINPNFKLIVRETETKEPYETLVDKQGNFYVKDLPYGKYELILSKDNIEKKLQRRIVFTDRFKCWQVPFFLTKSDLEMWKIQY